MQKRLCRRPEIFNDESIHYRIRSLCFCCHEMYTFIIISPRTESIVPPHQTTLDGKFIKWKNNKRTQIQTQSARTHTSVHISIPKDNKHTNHEIFFTNHIHFITQFIKHERTKMWWFFCECCSVVSHPSQRLNQIYEPVMKHFMLIVFVYEQINGNRAKRMMMWAYTQHDRIPEEFISCLQVIRKNN